MHLRHILNNKRSFSWRNSTLEDKKKKKLSERNGNKKSCRGTNVQNKNNATAQYRSDLSL